MTVVPATSTADESPHGAGRQVTGTGRAFLRWLHSSAGSLLVRERLGDWRFWVVQVLVVGVTVNHFLVEIFEPFHLHGAYFIPASLYLFPVLYASLNFGTSGAIPTAVWSALLAVPNVVLLHHGLEAVGEAFQVLTMALLGTVVALRVEKERVARRSAEAAEQERGASEVKYRSLFDSASEAILLVDASGSVREANAAALALVAAQRGELRGKSLTAIFGSQAQPILRQLSGDSGELPDLVLMPGGDGETWLEPRLTRVSSGKDVLSQVLLRDVTDRHGFQHYAQEVVQAQERERQWIAQELHDVSVQSAILICRRLDAASDAAEQGLPEDVLRALGDARTTAEDMADELRRFSRDLRPLILEDLGLVPALKRLIAELQARTQTPVRFYVSGPQRRLGTAVELALFRIAQESLRNVERHAEASRVSVSLSLGPTAVRLGITDNGKGFTVPPLTALVHEGRLGLLGMQERARLVGGRCQIRSSIGCGTRVVAEVLIS